MLIVHNSFFIKKRQTIRRCYPFELIFNVLLDIFCKYILSYNYISILWGCGWNTDLCGSSSLGKEHAHLIAPTHPLLAQRKLIYFLQPVLLKSVYGFWMTISFMSRYGLPLNYVLNANENHRDVSLMHSPVRIFSFSKSIKGKRFLRYKGHLVWRFIQ